MTLKIYRCKRFFTTLPNSQGENTCRFSEADPETERHDTTFGNRVAALGFGNNKTRVDLLDNLESWEPDADIRHDARRHGEDRGRLQGWT